MSKIKIKIKAMSKHDFDIMMVLKNLDDSNIELHNDLFLISINPSMIRDGEFGSADEHVGSKMIYKDDIVHPHYKEDHKNVLRLFYDDVVQDMLSYKAMDAEQGKKVLEFCELIKNCKEDKVSVMIHCTMGKSRSVATSYFLAEYLGIDISEVEAREDATPNTQVLNLLRGLNV